MSSPLEREPSPWVRKLRSDPVSERVAEAESARIDADTARREAELKAQEALAEQKRAEAVRVAAETTAAALARERDEALRRVAELEAELEATGETAAVEAPEPAPTAPARPAPGDVAFAPVRRGAGVVVVLALADLAAAAVAVYLAYHDRLATAPGLLAVAVTIALAASLRIGDRPESSVAIKQGTVVVTRPGGTERADLTDERTLVELVGAGPERRVVLLRKGKPTVTVDRSVVDVDRFVTAVRRWRPEA
ncbi:hypothetical protein G5V58_19570 [Nocardioides anomalus]|uniref:Uncharacterized protein n=1 Tax=Nocardioides anomalus TaxID=2712223 RepID=A0A6G6WHW2_9ACTN|nr:hypothetical protein [Nocardioides anomalus]QIG44685.1 hypothetical protein G5V58_19570 [Nocardioides anomalus]